MLKFSNLNKIYSKNSKKISALENINLHINTGEFVSLLGESGSGKSTILNIAGCLDKPSSGTYLLGNRDVSCVDDNILSTIRNNDIGFIFQSFYLQHHLTALENIMLPMVISGTPLRERKIRAYELLERMNLSDRATHRPSELSGGQKQRVCIARAMANNPKIILADEPTGNLDSKTGNTVIELLRSLSVCGITILMVTHNPKHASLSDRIIKIDKGQLTG